MTLSICNGCSQDPSNPEQNVPQLDTSWQPGKGWKKKSFLFQILEIYPILQGVLRPCLDKSHF